VADKEEKKAPEKKKTAVELLNETAEILASLTARQDATEVRVEQLAGQVEAHRMMLQREEKVQPSKVGVQKEDYPAEFHRSVAEGASSWSLITPTENFCDPGLRVNKFVAPCYAGVPMWVCTPFLTEAVNKGVIKGIIGGEPT
jgi:hypothetical protein